MCVALIDFMTAVVPSVMAQAFATRPSAQLKPSVAGLHIFITAVVPSVVIQACIFAPRPSAQLKPPVAGLAYFRHHSALLGDLPCLHFCNKTKHPTEAVVQIREQVSRSNKNTKKNIFICLALNDFNTSVVPSARAQEAPN